MREQQKLLTPASKSFRVYQSLKDEFLSGKWKFGQKISVSDVAKRFEVSRRPVLDAMKMLEHEGLVEIIPQTGSRVIGYSRKSVYDHFIISSVLEGLSAEWAARERSDTEILDLIEFNNSMKKMFMESQYEKIDYFKYNREVHYRLLLMSRSDELIELAVPMWDKNDFFIINIYEEFDVFVQQAWTSHDNIIAAVKERRPDKARLLMEEHVRSYVTQLMSMLP